MFTNFGPRTTLLQLYCDKDIFTFRPATNATVIGVVKISDSEKRTVASDLLECILPSGLGFVYPLNWPERAFYCE